MERFFNLVVTNVPGPQFPLYFLGRQMLACYPVVPLAAEQTVGIALLSYHGSVGVGLLGDADKARDLDRLGDFLKSALDRLGAGPRRHGAAPGDPSARGHGSEVAMPFTERGGHRIWYSTHGDAANRHCCW